MKKDEKTSKAGVMVSTKDWHYKLMKWFWGRRLAPSSLDTFNLCPYFWMLISTLILLPFISPFRFLLFIIFKLFNFMDKFMLDPILDNSAKSWYKELDDIKIYRIGLGAGNFKRSYAKKIENINDISRSEFTERWLWKNKKIKIYENKEKLLYSTKYIKWYEKQQEEWDKIEAGIDEKKKKRKEIEERYKKSLENFRYQTAEKFEAFGDYLSSRTIIIKWTKRFFGAVISLILTAISFIITIFISKGVLALISIITLLGLIGFLISAGMGIFVIGFVFFSAFLIHHSQEKGWKNFWWAKTFMYTIILPVYYIIYMPLRVIFYDIIFLLILINFWFLIKGAGISLWKGILQFGGIFGEYFGASKGDYCPGIEWKDD